MEELRRLHLGHSYQCGSCGFGPVSHTNCYDLAAHHGEAGEGGGRVNNACPSCGWFSEELEDWDAWDGTVPDSALPAETAQAPITEASIISRLHICYSARPGINH